MEIAELIRGRMLELLHRRLEEEHRLDDLAREVLQGRSDPYTLSEQVMEELLNHQNRR